MGIGKFQPLPHKINRPTPEPIDKKIGTIIDYIREGTSYTTHWRLLGKWVKYNKNYFYLFIYLYLFFSDSRIQVRPVDGFLRATAQKTWNHARMCLLGVWRCAPKFWGQNPQKTEILGVNRTFKPERQKIQTLITWKLLSRSRWNFYRQYGPLIRLREWSHGFPQQIQDGGGRHL